MAKKNGLWSGYKTYVAGGLLILTGLFGFYAGAEVIELVMAWNYLVAGLALIGIRNAMK